jgi:transcription-repair coupling factor (superfamily II helicase)
MSATPIPRSLNMALNGIKEVSILAHPPSSRLPIETYISKFDDNTIIEAGHKEFSRG